MDKPNGTKSVANFFLVRSAGVLTQMTLHKYIYLAHGWHLGLYGRPLIDEFLIAADWGPIAPSVFMEFRDIGARPIDRLAMDLDPETLYVFTPLIESSKKQPLAFLERIWEVYRERSGAQLSAIAKGPLSPWAQTKARAAHVKGMTIPNELIEEHFKKKIEAPAT